jgi:hypothetical protein
MELEHLQQASIVPVEQRFGSAYLLEMATRHMTRVQRVELGSMAVEMARVYPALKASTQTQVGPVNVLPVLKGSILVQLDQRLAHHVLWVHMLPEQDIAHARPVQLVWIDNIQCLAAM